MSLRYLAFRWDHRDEIAAMDATMLARELTAGTADWHVYEARGLRVLWLSGASPSQYLYTLAAHRGVVLGTVFRGRSADNVPSQISGFTPLEASAIAATRGKELLQRFWGRYVAIVHEPEADRTSVLRDPSGAITAYHTSVGAVDVFFSHPGEIARFRSVEWTVDWDYVCLRLVHNRMQNGRTGLVGVHQLNAGECLEISRSGRSLRQYWDPRDVACRDVIDDPREAAAELRAITQACISAWAFCHKVVVHRLSGGLDSSIVLGCLAASRERPTLVCVNYATPTAEGDEREFAALAAHAASCSLIELQQIPSAVRLQHAAEIQATVAPPLWLADLDTERREAQIARQLGVDAFFSGRGGDNVFYNSRNPAIAADYFHERGFHEGILGAIKDAARLSQRSVWEVAASTLRYAAGRRAAHPLSARIERSHFLADDVVHGCHIDDLLHPWIKDYGNTPPAKFEQIYALVDCQNYFSPVEHADYVYPLVSQPLVELCLRIPTYLLCMGGRDRGLARDAFRDLVPSRILRRTSKGRITGYICQVLLANIPFLRTFLGEGLLAEKGLVDRERLRVFLSERTILRNGLDGLRIIEYFGVEAWLRTWSATLRKVAA